MPANTLQARIGPVDQVVERLENASPLDPVVKAVRRIVNSALKPQKVRDALHGVWFGHPLHPVLTDIPIGAWTAALALDALDAASEDDFAPGADAAIALGLAGAVGSAVTGLTDWKELDTKPLRIGLLHGMLNLGATILYAASLILRRRGVAVQAQVRPRRPNHP